eukprot:TRINITY_DN535_c0_g1_i9.p5 TRINITY_DN535_c0_g1~~TRINITY_DN535_c0_g1_i9.p5  ORF type:complete len:129 (+),score=29.69 TRINITY_DN535_c0_g1_i9:67-453(+)
MCIRDSSKIFPAGNTTNTQSLPHTARRDVLPSSGISLHHLLPQVGSMLSNSAHIAYEQTQQFNKAVQESQMKELFALYKDELLASLRNKNEVVPKLINGHQTHTPLIIQQAARPPVPLKHHRDPPYLP